MTYSFQSKHQQHVDILKLPYTKNYTSNTHIACVKLACFRTYSFCMKLWLLCLAILFWYILFSSVVIFISVTFDNSYYIISDWTIWVTRQKKELCNHGDHLDSPPVFCVVLLRYLFCVLCQMLPVFLDCPFLIVPSVFSNVYHINDVHLQFMCAVSQYIFWLKMFERA
jgi:hypothetical protein